jgi:predicted permease
MFWRRKRTHGDLAREMEAHLALEADRIEQEGKTREQAEAAAHRAFGNAASVHESYYESGRWLFADRLLRDLRHAARLMRRRPGFSAIVVGTLALGIGATTAIFGVTDAVLLSPLPYREPDRLAMLWQADPAHGVEEGRVSLLGFADWKSRARSFSAMTVFAPQTFLLGNGDGPPERMRAARISADFFPLLGVAPLRGRVFSNDEEQRAEHVVVLSCGLWLSRFGGSDRALGADLTMDGRPYRVIGVMPQSFRFPFNDTQVWQPMTSHPYWRADRAGPRSEARWFALGRLRDGVALTAAQAEMSGIGHALAAEHPESKQPPDVRVVQLPLQTTGSARLPLAILFGAVFMMLVIACINVANLLLARGSAREREFAVRKALGAGRYRLAAQLLTESMVLAIVGGAFGVALASVALKALVAYGPRDIPRLNEAHIGAPVLLFALALSVFTALASGLWPAFAQAGNKAAGSMRSRQWNTLADRGVRNVLVVGEFALALILLAGGGLMARSYFSLLNVDPGFRPENMLIMRVDLHVGRTADQQVEYFRTAIQRVQALPGVQSAGAVQGFLRTDPEDAVVVEGQTAMSPGPCEDAIEGAFFAASGIPLLKGRTFTDLDRRDSPAVTIVNQTTAQRYWPGQEAIGKRFRFPGERGSPWITVVGVAGDARRQGIENGVLPQVFRPLAQDTDDMLEILVRTSVRPDSMAASVQQAIQSIDPSVAKFSVSTVERQMGDDEARRRFQTSLLGAFSLMSLLLSAIGIYGLMHYFVAQHVGEIGVRMALGARYGDVMALVLRQGLGLAATGLLLGTLGALAVTQLLRGLLYGVTPTDPPAFIAAGAIVFAAAALASWIPARRAARIDPMTALRQG